MDTVGGYKEDLVFVRRLETGSQESGVRRQETEDRSQESEYRIQETGNWKLETGPGSY